MKIDLHDFRSRSPSIFIDFNPTISFYLRIREGGGFVDLGPQFCN